MLYEVITDQVPNFGITPREIIRGLVKVNKMLNLPHTIHLHTNNLGIPGNYITTLETMKAIEDLSTDGKPICHITHLQFSSFGGEDWGSMQSRITSYNVCYTKLLRTIKFLISVLPQEK